MEKFKLVFDSCVPSAPATYSQPLSSLVLVSLAINKPPVFSNGASCPGHLSHISTLYVHKSWLFISKVWQSIKVISAIILFSILTSPVCHVEFLLYDIPVLLGKRQSPSVAQPAHSSSKGFIRHLPWQDTEWERAHRYS